MGDSLSIDKYPLRLGEPGELGENPRQYSLVAEANAGRMKANNSIYGAYKENCSPSFAHASPSPRPASVAEIRPIRPVRPVGDTDGLPLGA